DLVYRIKAIDDTSIDGVPRAFAAASRAVARLFDPGSHIQPNAEIGGANQEASTKRSAVFRDAIHFNSTSVLSEQGSRLSQPPGNFAVRNVVVVGGGTAGYFAALAIKRALPSLQVTLIESSKIPIIGVGEATTTLMPPFLHLQLGIDILEL